MAAAAQVAELPPGHLGSLPKETGRQPCNGYGPPDTKKERQVSNKEGNEPKAISAAGADGHPDPVTVAGAVLEIAVLRQDIASFVDAYRGSLEAGADETVLICQNIRDLEETSPATAAAYAIVAMSMLADATAPAGGEVCNAS